MIAAELDKYPDNFVDVGMDDYGNIYHRDADGRNHNPYGPALIWPSGTKVYYIHGKCHRTDGPAVIWNDGSKEYYIHGTRHRTDGPAIMYPSGDKEYYVNGNYLSEEEFNKLYVTRR